VPTVLENDQRNTQGEDMSRSVCGICMCPYGDAGDCACKPKGEAMTKEEALQAIKLLSALESWAFSLKERMPDYLHEDLCRSMDVLDRIVLEKP
jgi:hypothetical protein